MKIQSFSAITVALLACTLFTAGVGCREKSVKLQPADQTYTLRGVIYEMPAEGEASPEVMIEHEAIPNFVNAQGKVVGMNTMTMPFALAPGVSVMGLKAGDPVEFTFEMRWKSQPRLQTTTIKALPPGTQIEFDTTKTEANEAEPTTTTQQME